MSGYSQNKGSRSDWYSDSFSWELSVFDQYPEMKLRVSPAGCGDGKGTHLSVQLYLAKGGCKRHFIALEQQNIDNYNKLSFIWQQERERLEKETRAQRKTKVVEDDFTCTSTCEDN